MLSEFFQMHLPGKTAGTVYRKSITAKMWGGKNGDKGTCVARGVRLLPCQLCQLVLFVEGFRREFNVLQAKTQASWDLEASQPYHITAKDSVGPLSYIIHIHIYGSLIKVKSKSIKPTLAEY